MLLVLVAFGFFQPALAQLSGVQTCRIMIVDPTLPGGALEKMVDVPDQASGTHGGEMIVTEVAAHKVEMNADGKWRNITWSKNGAVIARTVTLAELIHRGIFVVILFNPADDEEQVSLGCEPKL